MQVVKPRGNAAVLSLFASGWTAAFLLLATLEAASGAWAVALLLGMPARVREGSSEAALALFMGLTAAKFLWRGLAEISLRRVQTLAMTRFVATVVGLHTARPDLRGEPQARERFCAGLAGVGIDIVTGLVHVLDRLHRTVVSALLLLAVFAHALGTTFLLASLAGLVAAVLLGARMTPRQQHTSRRFETRRLQLAGLATAGWDSITIGNAPNLSRWRPTMLRTFRNFAAAQAALSWTTVSSQWAVLLASHLPPLAALCIGFDAASPDAMLTIAVGLPGVLALLSSQAELAALFATTGVLAAQWKVLGDFLQPPRSVDVLERVDLSRMRIHHPEGELPAGSIDEMVAALPPEGIVTISAPNGSGKSSLLVCLKAWWGERAFYLPAVHSLLPSRRVSLSTGEAIVDQVRAALSDRRVDVLLLDEWRANLDRDNAAALERLLYAAARQGRLIVEASPERAAVPRSSFASSATAA